MTCQCGFIGYNKCITLVGNVDNVEALHLWRKSIYGKSLCLLLNLATNLKFWKILKSITISMDLHSLRGKPKIININCKAYDKQNSTCAYNLISLYLLSLFGFYQCLTYVMLFFHLYIWFILPRTVTSVSLSSLPGTDICILFLRGIL